MSFLFSATNFMCDLKISDGDHGIFTWWWFYFLSIYIYIYMYACVGYKYGLNAVELPLNYNHLILQLVFKEQKQKRKSESYNTQYYYVRSSISNYGLWLRHCSFFYLYIHLFPSVSSLSSTTYREPSWHYSVFVRRAMIESSGHSQYQTIS